MTQNPLRLLNLLVLCACFAVGASAQQVTLDMTQVNPQSYAVYGDGGGVFTSPYTFSVTAGGITTPSILLSCDDFMDDVFTGESWTANVTSLQNNILGEASPNTTVYFDTASVANQEQQYSEVAFLAADLMLWGSANGYGNQKAAEYSFAIWSIFDSPGVAAFMADGVSDGSQTLNNFANDVNNYVAAAVNFVTGGGTVANETIYTPVAGTQNPSGDPAPQEFIQVSGSNLFAATPEPSFLVGLLIDLFCVVGLVAVLHRRLARTN